MSEEDRDRATTRLVDDVSTWIVDDVSDVVVDLDSGDLDLTQLSPGLGSSFLGQSVDGPEFTEEELEAIIARSVFGRPEPQAPTPKAPEVRIRKPKEPGPTRPRRARAGGSLFTGTNTIPAVEAQPTELDIDDPPRVRTRVAPPERRTGAGVPRALVWLFVTGLVGAVISTAVLQFRDGSGDAQPEPNPTSVVTTVAPAPPTTPATTTPTTTPVTTTIASTVPEATDLTLPDISFPRPSWAPDSVGP